MKAALCEGQPSLHIEAAADTNYTIDAGYSVQVNYQEPDLGYSNWGDVYDFSYYERQNQNINALDWFNFLPGNERPFFTWNPGVKLIEHCPLRNEAQGGAGLKGSPHHRPNDCGKRNRHSHEAAPVSCY